MARLIPHLLQDFQEIDVICKRVSKIYKLIEKKRELKEDDFSEISETFGDLNQIIDNMEIMEMENHQGARDFKVNADMLMLRTYIGIKGIEYEREMIGISKYLD